MSWPGKRRGQQPGLGLEDMGSMGWVGGYLADMDSYSYPFVASNMPVSMSISG